MNLANQHIDLSQFIPKIDYEKLELKTEKLEKKNKYLEEQLAEFRRLIYGSKSERYVTAPVADGQMDLFTKTALSEVDNKETEQEITYKRKVKGKKKEKPVRSTLPDHFPRVEEIIEPENIIEGSKKIGEVVTEILEYHPMSIFVRKIIRPKYATPTNDGVVIADMPSLPLPKSNAGASVLSHISVSKFIDHLPFYRQISILKRQDLEISASTMGGWFKATCKLMSPLYDTLQKQVINNCDYLQADESPIGVQDSNKKGALHQGYMWLFRNPENKLVLFNYNKGRSREAPEEVLENFTGFLQTDGYRVYSALSVKGDITLLGCMAHARRYFEKALTYDKENAEHVLLEIQKLYTIEQNIRDQSLDAEAIQKYRDKYAKPIMIELEKWLEGKVYEILPKSLLGKAVAYMLNIFPNLKRYLDDGRFEIDNNNIENAVRPLALGRKNYLFAGSHEAAQNAAMMYSFFSSCKANNVNPHEWMTDVLNRLPEHKVNQLNQLLPDKWEKSNK